MANRERGEVSVRINDRDFTFVLDTTAMTSVEELLSTPEREVTWDEFWLRVIKGSARACLVLLWAMTRTHHKELTTDAVRALVDEAGGLAGFLKVIESAQRAATPDPADVKTLGLKLVPAGGKKKNP